MKRYRTQAGLWDGRAVILKSLLERESGKRSDLEENNLKRLMAELSLTYGNQNLQQKVARFVESGYLNISILHEHNSLLLSVRDSYVMGHYYPALTAACALAERILNDLILKMRNYYSTSDKALTKNNAFTNWGKMIGGLLEWEIITEKEATDFRQMKKLRTYSIHYDPNLKVDLKEKSKTALELVGRIVHSVFSASIPEKYRIPDTKGAFFIKKSAENHPFIREYFIPNCIYVGPQHKITNVMSYPMQFSDSEYPDAEITDEEFALHFK